MEDGREHEGKIYDFKTGQLLATTGTFSDKVRKHTPTTMRPSPPVQSLSYASSLTSCAAQPLPKLRV